MGIISNHYKSFLVIPYIFIASKSYDITFGWLCWSWTIWFTPAEVDLPKNAPLAVPLTVDDIFSVMTIEEINDIHTRLEERENDNIGYD